jgi:hypothetical protein
MFKKISEWYSKQKTTILLCAIVFVLTFYYAPYFMNKHVEGNFDGSIQNKLVWSIKGECFFVRPLNQTNTLLVRVKDCDKTDVIQKVGK